MNSVLDDDKKYRIYTKFVLYGHEDLIECGDDWTPRINAQRRTVIQFDELDKKATTKSEEHPSQQHNMKQMWKKGKYVE